MIAPKAIAGLVPLAAFAAAQFHPAIDPEISRQQIWEGLLPNMATAEATYEDWEAGWIFQSCKSEAEQRGLAPTDMEVFNVHYSDCGEPWAMCRHKDVTSPTKEEMIESFGRLPVRSRSYVKHVIVFPSLGDAAGLFYDYNIMFGQDTMDYYVLIHETTHALDSGARQDIGSPFSDSAAWQEPYALDSAVPTPYAETSWGEGYAEVGPVAFYDMYVPGGLAAIQPNIAQIQNQLNTFRDYLGETIQVGGECANRIPNTETVPMIEGARVMQSLGNKPDTSFKTNVTVLDLPPAPRIVFGPY